MDKEKYALNGNLKSHAGMDLTKFYDFNLGLFEIGFMDEIEAVISDLTPCNLFGLESFGAWVVCYLAGRMRFKSVYYFNPIIIRKEKSNKRKDYYCINFDSKLKSYLFHDVITTGDSINYGLNIIGEHLKIEIDAIICVKNRSNLTHIRKIPIIEI